VTRHQRLDILIANAGITHRAQLAEWTSEAWDGRKAIKERHHNRSLTVSFTNLSSRQA
jgi:hypothetical protein